MAEKPTMNELIHRDALFFALYQNKRLFRFYIDGISDEEFITENKTKLNNLISGMRKMYDCPFNNLPWLKVGVRMFLDSLQFPTPMMGYGLIPEHRTKKVVGWDKKESRYI